MVFETGAGRVVINVNDRGGFTTLNFNFLFMDEQLKFNNS